MQKLHFSKLKDYHQFAGLPDPEHPLFSVISMDEKATEETAKCFDGEACLSSDFYSISLKHIISGEIHYGRTKYDCSNGTMLFMAPKQEIILKNVEAKSTGKSILIHEDFIRGYQLKDQIQKYHYFSYAVHEALHLSPKEEQMIRGIFELIEQEYHNNEDEFSKGLIISHIETLLRYANRYYNRQFLHRKEQSSDLLTKFTQEIDQALSVQTSTGKYLPNVEEIAEKLKMTPRYLSDALKVETGKTAIENLHLHIIDKAKDSLLRPNITVARVAYELGFDTPQYFARLFKKKTGQTPSQYVKSQA